MTTRNGFYIDGQGKGIPFPVIREAIAGSFQRFVGIPVVKPSVAEGNP
jgi:hypothetical protein